METGSANGSVGSIDAGEYSLAATVRVSKGFCESMVAVVWAAWMLAKNK